MTGRRSTNVFDGVCASGEAIHALASRLYPINRSITGDGVRRTLDMLGEHVPLERHEVPSGTKVLDWIVPPEWNLYEAYIATSDGRRVVDVADHALHVVGYSTPVRERMSLAQLRPHLHALPKQPDLIPYKTSYYTPAWGFCLAQKVLDGLREDSYEVVIDATLGPASLTYGEYLHKGRGDAEVLLSAHMCHPSLANDNCSGVAVLALLAAAMQGRETRLSYRFLFAPGTIGAITWLARNRAQVGRIEHGLIVSNIGDGGGPTYKRSRRGNAAVDRAAAHVLGQSWASHALRDFSPYGYDERQYCSPGFDLPVGSLQRSAWGEFPEYHTSADNLDFIQPQHLEGSFRLIVAILDVLEHNEVLVNSAPFGEPQLGPRGLLEPQDGMPLLENDRMAYLWVLNLCDGSRDLLAVAERSGLAFAAIVRAATRLRAVGLVAPIAVRP